MKTHEVTGGAGLKLHVREWGPADGKCLLLIHGWSQNHLSWRCQFESALADEFRIAALDLRGHGMSEKPATPDAYTDSQLWADDIKAIIDQLGLDRPVLSGWSYGGLVISDYLRLHGQEKISAVNYVCAATNMNENAFGTEIGPGFLENFDNATAADLPTSLAGIRRFLQQCFEVEPTPECFEETLLFNAVVPASVRGFLAQRDIDNTDVLESLTVPVLITQGAKDIVVTPKSAEHIERHCSTARLSMYKDIGHVPFVEDAERFNQELADLARSAS